MRYDASNTAEKSEKTDLFGLIKNEKKQNVRLTVLIILQLTKPVYLV